MNAVHIIWLFTFAILVGCGTPTLYISGEGNEHRLPEPPHSELFYSIFLIGDTGDSPAGANSAVLNLLKSKADEAGEQSTLVFLGDQVYPAGLPAEEHPERETAESTLLAQLEVINDHPGDLYFIPGNHDWNNARAGGLEAVQRQEEFVEKFLDRGNTFLPDHGFPGPIDIELVDDDDTPFNKDIRLVILDTQWWLSDQEKPYGDTGEYDLEDADDFLVEFEDVIRKRQNDHLIIAAHHPLYSNGRHGGYFPAKRHLLPPVFGSLYVLYRKVFGYSQDLSHYRYQLLKKELMAATREVPNLIYASGHEHSLQYFRVNRRRTDHHFIVSGSGSRESFVRPGMGAEFTYQGRGFQVVRYYRDGSTWLETWTPDEATGAGKRIYHARMAAPEEDPFFELEADTLAPSPDFTDSMLTIAANAGYDKPGTFYRTILGYHNRELWGTPVTVPVFDIASVEGGLEAVKLGGKGQSNTLRLQRADGRDFVLRSIDKEAGRVWDEHLKNTIAQDLAQDQFSIFNPYGAFMVPPLADATGIYHTNPKLYYIPHDYRLGQFAKKVGGRLALFEERPDGDMRDAAHFGNSTEVISTRDMLNEVTGDLDHRVDQEMMLKNRLLDLFISDWDRHEDQWRWASFEPYELDSTLTGDARTHGKIYRPIPRDRDTAFLVMNGVIPTYLKFTSFPNYQSFSEHYGNLKGLSKNSLALTRRFTNELTLEQWISMAEQMADSLDDQVFEESIARLPIEIQQKIGARLKHVMQQRRDQLAAVAESYYGLINKVVDVVGTQKKEYIEINILDSNRTRVRIFKREDRDNPDRVSYFDRIFLSDETKELRIYGLGDDDDFAIKSAARNPILIRIVGGSGNDHFLAEEMPESYASNIRLYDTKEGNRLNGVSPIQTNLTDRSTLNRYDYRYGYRYNTGKPMLFLGHNNDDGLFIGGGAEITIHGFNKEPYAARHTIRGNVAARTGAFNILYGGHFPEVTGPWDARLDLTILTPNNIRNFLGLGNETESGDDRDENYYQARLWQYRVAPALQRNLPGGMDFSVGPYFQITNVREDQGRFIGQPQAGISPNTFEDQWYTGLQLRLGFHNADDLVNPKQGFRWSNRADLNLGVRNTSDNYATLGSSLSLYLSPSLEPQLTVATRVGWEHNIGPFPFYSANTLGGVYNLRGLRSTRYNGRTSFFNNIELRSKLADLDSYLLGGELGLLGFLDQGRVWTDGESSDRWHVGYGGGIWFNLFRMTVVRASIGIAEDEWNVLVGAGFFF